MMTAATCTLKRFMQMWFDEPETEEFKSIHLEYVDLSGLTKTKELELNAQLYNLQNRVERVKWLIFSLRLSVYNFDKPFTAGIEDLKSYGHILYWDNDVNQFYGMLNKIETKEKKFLIQFNEKEKELNEFISSLKTGETQTTVQTRHQFIKNIIELRKRGHYIIEDITTVETLALIIKLENDEAEKQKIGK